MLSEVTPQMPAWAQEVFGPVAPVVKFSTAEEAAALAAQTEYGLSLGILTSDVMRGLDLARKIPTGIVHINEQTVDDEANVPFGGIFDSAPAPLRRHRQPGRVHRDALDHHPGRHCPVSVLRAATLVLHERPAIAAPAATSLPEMSLPEWRCSRSWPGSPPTASRSRS